MIKKLFKPFLDFREFFVLIELLVIYMCLALPFAKVEFIEGFSNLRPVSILIPVYGLYFGMAGAWASGIGNLLFDVLTGGLAWSSSAGFIANFALPIFYRILWRLISPRSISVTNSLKFCQFALVVFIATALKCLIIAPVIAYCYPEVPIFDFCVSVYASDGVFPLFPGIAILIMINPYYDEKTQRFKRDLFLKDFRYGETKSNV